MTSQHPCARHRDHLGDAGPVEGHRQLGGRGVHPAHQLRRALRVEVLAAWVLAFRGEGEEEVAATFQAARLEDGPELLVGGARVGGGLEEDQLPWAQALRDLAPGGVDVRVVRLAVRPERRGHADGDGVAVAQAVEVGGGVVPAALHRRGDPLGSDVLDEGLALAERLDLAGVDVEAGDLEAGLVEEQGEGQADVALADDADPGGAVAELGEKGVFHGGDSVGRKGWDAERKVTARRRARGTARDPGPPRRAPPSSRDRRRSGFAACRWTGSGRRARRTSW